MNKLLLIIIILILVGLVGLLVLKALNKTDNTMPEQEKISFVKINQTEIEVETSDTLSKIAKGLSNRESLPENRGMLFLYNEPKYHAFWMKDMRFPIDIIWIDENLQIIDITRNAAPDSYPQKFRPQKPAQYVLEVSAGFVEKNNIRIEDIVVIE